MRRLKLPRTQHLCAMLLHKRNVAARPHIVPHSHQKQRRRIGRGILIWQRLPVHLVRSLRVLVHHLAIGPLPLQQKRKLVPRQRKIPIAIHRKQRIQRITPKEPPKARTRRIPRCIVPRDQPHLTLRGTRPQLANRRLRPPKRRVQPRVRRNNPRHVSLLRGIACAVSGIDRRQLLIECRQLSRQRLPRGRLARTPHRHQQRKHLAPIRLRIHAQMKLQRMRLRPLLVRRHDPVRRSRKRNRPREVRKVAMQHIQSAHALRHPLRRRLPAAQRRPHLAQLRRKPKRQLHRMQRIHRKQHHRARPRVHPICREHRLPHRHRNMRVCNRRPIRPHLDLPRHRVQLDRHRIALDVRLNRHVAQQLHRQHPRLELALLLSHQHAARSGHRKRLARLHRLRQHRPLHAQRECSRRRSLLRKHPHGSHPGKRAQSSRQHPGTPP